MPRQGNFERCLVLRQQYAMKMLPMLDEGTRIINIDESWLNETNFIRKMWAPKDVSSTASLYAVSPRLSLLAAIDTTGRCWYALT